LPGEQDIDIRVPRECVYQRFEKEPGPCPRCGGTLRQSYQSYVISTRRGATIEGSFIAGGKMGWFCMACPTVVLNAQEISEMLGATTGGEASGAEFAVLGLVDFDAIPANKRNEELGTDDNPIPLVSFRSVSRAATGQPVPAPRKSTGQPARTPRKSVGGQPRRGKRRTKRK
jgi:hypothetical protein